MKKKLFSNKMISKEKFVKFLDKEGFYVVVFLCIAIIATTAVYITRNNMDYFSQNDGKDNEVTENINDHEYFQPEDLQKEPDDEGQQASANKDEPEKKETEDTEKQEDKTKEDKTISDKEVINNATPVISQNKEDEKEENKTNTNKSSGENILSKLVKPVESNTITMDYSYQTQPVFSTTLNEFRSDHQGIDITAEKGTSVMAAMDGKVIDIQEDPRVGVLITIDHGNGIKTKYGNLSEKVTVTKNQEVKRGQTIGQAGNTAMFEIEDAPHIHFEVWNGDKPVSAKNYIKDLKNTTN